MSRKKKKITVGFLKLVMFIALVGGVGLLSWYFWAIEPYSAAGNGSTIISIAPGITAAQLGEQLKERQLIRSAQMFRLLARARNEEFKLYVGNYELSPQMTPDEMINRLISTASTQSNRVMIPEGYTTNQIISLLVEKEYGSKEEFTKVVTEDAFPYTFLKDAPKGIHRLEGYLFPNTYEIDKKTSPHAVIDLLLRQFEKQITPQIQQQLDIMNLSISQWVTLASLIEKEAVKAEDRPLIASVLHNRLKINQPLQIDATIQFLFETPKPKLFYKDLQIPSPYNTYLHSGYPPGPIASPGSASLHAVLYPAQTDFRYYVAKKDGYHAFAKTYAEHLKNIELYLK